MERSLTSEEKICYHDAIETIAKCVHDRQASMKSTMDKIHDAVIALKNRYEKEIKAYEENGALVDLLPFDYLGPLKGTFYERAHTMILAFLWNPKTSGDYSKHFLKELLSKNPDTDIGGNFTIKNVISENTTVRSRQTQGKPDIVIEISDEKKKIIRKVVIENKCLALESKNQTCKYVEGNGKKICKECKTDWKGDKKKKKKKNNNNNWKCLGGNKADTIYIYVDYKGRKAECPRFENMDYNDIKDALEKARGVVLQKRCIGEGKSLDLFIQHYIRTLEYMGKEEIIVPYSELESRDTLSLVQFKYLSERISATKMEDDHDYSK